MFNDVDQLNVSCSNALFDGLLFYNAYLCITLVELDFSSIMRAAVRWHQLIIYCLLLWNTCTAGCRGSTTMAGQH